jgi:hypothetical protein
MDNLLKRIVESISGIWGNSKYELVLGLNNVFTFEEKKSGEIIDGFYLILQIPQNPYYTLRLTELNGLSHDYDIIDVIIFHTLIISLEGKTINLKNIPPDEYDGEVFNPADN